MGGAPQCALRRGGALALARRAQRDISIARPCRAGRISGDDVTRCPAMGRASAGRGEAPDLQADGLENIRRMLFWRERHAPQFLWHAQAGNARDLLQPCWIMAAIWSRLTANAAWAARAPGELDLKLARANPSATGARSPANLAPFPPGQYELVSRY